MKLVFFAHLIGVVYSIIYQKVSKTDLSNLQVVYEEREVASKLSCVQKCLRFKCDAWYDKNVCRCVSVSEEMSAFDENEQLQDELYMKYMGSMMSDKPVDDIIFVSQNNQIGIISKIAMEYHLRLFFKFKASKMSYNWYNLFHITDDKRKSRHPLISFKRKSSNCVYSHICAPVSGNWDFPTDTDHDITWYDNWNEIDVSQQNTVHGYVFRILINGDQVRNIINKTPAEYTNMKIYASNNGFPVDEGKIKLKFIKGYQGAQLK